MVAFQPHKPLPLDDCFYALQPLISHLTRPTLHPCLQRVVSCVYQTSRRDFAEAQTAEGKLYLFVDIDRISRFTVTQLFKKAEPRTGWEFMEPLLPGLTQLVPARWK